MRNVLVRLVLLVLTLIALCAPALALEDWRMQVFSLTAETAWGEQALTAVPAEENGSQAFYLYVPPELTGASFVLHASHPNHPDWYYDIPDGTELAIASYPAEYAVGAVNSAGQLQDTFFLTVSDQPYSPMGEPQQTQAPQAQQASVLICYYDAATNELIETGSFGPYPDGNYTITASPVTLGPEWELVSDASAQVYITFGMAMPDTVSFYYSRAGQALATDTPAPVYYPVDVLIHYIDADTMLPVAPDGAFTIYADGSYTIQAGDPGSGWAVQGPVSQTVSALNGMPQPSQVYFSCRKIFQPTDTPAPTEAPYALVTVYHLDADTSSYLISPETLTLTDGWHTVSPRADLSGYEPETDTGFQVWVSGGKAEPDSVVFRYRRAAAATAVPTATEAPRQALITVRYIDTDTGLSVSPDEVLTYGDGDWLIAASPVSLPQGYEAIGDTSVVVTVAGGMASLPEVVFHYRREAAATAVPATAAPVSASVTVVLRNTAGEELARYDYLLSGSGSAQIPLLAAWVPAGYSAAGVHLQTATVTADGRAVPSEISYTLSRAAAQETPIPHGESINRWGTTTSSVRFREGSSTSDHIIRNLSAGTWVWAIRETQNAAGEYWTYCQVDGRYGFISSSFLSVLSQAESDDRQGALATPAPFSTWGAPTAAPVTAAPIVTQPPALTAQPLKYTGYAVALDGAVLRESASATSGMIGQMAAGEVVMVEDQRWDAAGQTWSQVSNLSTGLRGYVRADSLRAVSEMEAQLLLNMDALATPSPAPATAQPTQAPTAAQVSQVIGYAYTIGDDVRLRSTWSDRSVILSTLSRDTAVFVAGQVYNPEDGWYWHSVQYAGIVGYIRTDMLRMMTQQEQDAYLRGFATATPAPQATPETLTGHTLSSYGYVTGLTGNSNVNMRREPSQRSNVITRLYQYALCRVYGSVEIDGQTWYNVSYGYGSDAVTGYISGKYFHQMTLDEFDAFMVSEEYQQGVRNNTSGNAGSTAAPTRLYTEEEQLTERWQDPRNNENVNYATWVPIATTAPLSTDAAEGVTATPAPTATPSPTFAPIATPEPIATVTPVPTGRGGGMSTGLVVVIVLGVVGVGTGYIYSLHRRNRRNAAQRAAQRRAQAAAAQRMNAEGRPYARPASDPAKPSSTAAPTAPRTGAYTAYDAARGPAATPPSLEKTYQPYADQTGAPQRHRRSERKSSDE